MNDDAVMPEEPTDALLADACLWESHDFGLCESLEKRHRMAIMRTYWRAIWRSLNTPGHGVQYAPPGDQPVEPACWRREWRGDMSDLWDYVYTDDEDDTDDGGTWEPLYDKAAIEAVAASFSHDRER